MPSEVRRLVFFHSELSDALKRYGEKYNVNFPEGKILKAKLASGAEYELHTQKSQPQELSQQYNVKDIKSSIIVTFFNEATFEHKYFNLTSEFVAAALIQYCLDSKIPLPRNGKKKLDLTEFNACLDIIIEDEEGGSLELELD